MAYGSLRDKLMGTDIRTPGAISQFEAFGRHPEREGPTNPFAGLTQATAPMANAGTTALGGASLNGAPTTTAAPPVMSTGAPLGTFGTGGPFTFGNPFGDFDRGDREPGAGAAEGSSTEAAEGTPGTEAEEDEPGTEAEEGEEGEGGEGGI